MKKIRRVLALTLLLLFVQSLSFPVFAQSTDDIDAALRQRGYPQTLLDVMSPIAKESIYEKDDFTFSGGTITAYDETNKLPLNYVIPSNGIMPLGAIPDSDLYLTWSAGRNSAGDVHLVFSYFWTETPVNHYDDPLYIVWEQDIFRLKSNSFYKVDQYDTYFNEGLITSSSYNHSGSSFSGVTWYAELPEAPSIRCYGHGEMILEVLTSSHGTTQFFGQYIHNLTTIGISVNISDSGSVSISGGDSYDSRGSEHLFYY